MVIPNILSALYPLIIKFDMKFWSDPVIMIVPPNFSGSFSSWAPPGKGELILGFRVGGFYEYDISQNKIIGELESEDIVFWREAKHSKWHKIIASSVYKGFYPDFSVTKKGFECRYKIENMTTDKYVYIPYTSYLLEFDISYESEIQKYFKNYVDFFMDRVWERWSE